MKNKDKNRIDLNDNKIGERQKIDFSGLFDNFLKEGSIRTVFSVSEDGTKVPVLQLTKDYDIIKCFNCSEEASLESGVSKSEIEDVCEGLKITAGGFIWKFINHYVKIDTGTDAK